MASKQLSAVITIGGTITSGLKTAIGSTQRGLRQIGGTVRSLERDQNKLGKSMRDAMNNGRPIGAMHTQYQALGSQIAKARREQERFTKAVHGLEVAKGKMGQAIGAIGAVVAVGATLGAPVVAAAKFETAMLGVAKQVDGARDANGRFTKTFFDMRREIQMLGREIPIATNDLAGMVAAGARMGIAKENLIDFTRTAAMMSSAFDLPADELADNMGKIANLYKIPIPEIRKLADAINYLDDNSLSKGADIIDFLSRTGGVASAVHITGKEMSALGSTLLSLGEKAEPASTATNAFIQKLAAADHGTKNFRRALTDLGLSAGAVQKGMQIDSQGTILQVLEAVQKLPKEKQLGVLTDLVGLEHSDTLAKLANGIGEYRKQIDMVNSQKVEGSMGREFAAQLATTNAQWEITKNRVVEVGVNIGSVLLPAVNSFLGVVGQVTSAISDWTREHPVLTKNMMAVVGATLASVGAINTFKFAIAAVPAVFNALRVAIMTNPIGLALTAIAVGAVLIYENWEPIKGFFLGVWDSIKAGAVWCWDTLKTVFLNATPMGLVIKHWGPISNFFSNLWNGIKSTVAGAVDWILGKIAAVGNTWNTVKGWFGGGDSAAASAPGGGGRVAPAAPRMATARGALAAPNVTHNWQISQQPGQSSKALADDIMRRMDARDSRRRGSLLYDRPAGA